MSVYFYWLGWFVLVDVVLDDCCGLLGCFRYKRGITELFAESCRGTLLFVDLRHLPKIVIVINILSSLDAYISQIRHRPVAITSKGRTPSSLTRKRQHTFFVCTDWYLFLWNCFLFLLFFLFFFLPLTLILIIFFEICLNWQLYYWFYWRCDYNLSR